MRRSVPYFCLAVLVLLAVLVGLVLVSALGGGSASSGTWLDRALAVAFWSYLLATPVLLAGGTIRGEGRWPLLSTFALWLLTAAGLGFIW